MVKSGTQTYFIRMLNGVNIVNGDLKMFEDPFLYSIVLGGQVVELLVLEQSKDS